MKSLLQKKFSINKNSAITENLKKDSPGNNQDEEGNANLINYMHPIELIKIGQLLKEKREEKALSVEYISKNLCLQKTIIESIEQGQWVNLPHIVYVKGYIRKYSELLGIYDKILPYTIENKLEKDSDKSITNSIYKTEKKTSHLYVLKKTPKKIYAYSIIIVLMLGFFIFGKAQKDISDTSQLETAIRVANNINEEYTDKSVPGIVGTKKLMITCHERTWISVIIDDTEKKEFMLKPQEVVIFNAKDKFDLLIGNAGGIKLILSGKDIGFTGESGQVKRVTLP